MQRVMHSALVHIPLPRLAHDRSTTYPAMPPATGPVDGAAFAVAAPRPPRPLPPLPGGSSTASISTLYTRARLFSVERSWSHEFCSGVGKRCTDIAWLVSFITASAAST